MALSFVRTLARRATSPKSSNEDLRRREFILNVLLVGLLAMFFAAVMISGMYSFFGDPVVNEHNTLPTILVTVLFGLFLFFYILSRSGAVKLVSYVLLVLLFALATYMASMWGVDLPAATLFYVLVIVMSGILISTRFAFVSTVAIVLSMFLVGTLQASHVILANRYWASQGWTATDIAVASVMLLIIATVSWLSNREIEKSLARARRSEAELTKERDLLEVRVEERTRELREAELRRMSQTYRFVEFGRVASGIFHDLVNPLTALSLNIESIGRSRGADDPRKLALLERDVESAKSATAHMQKLLDSMRRHLAREGKRERFQLASCLSEIAHVMAPYGRRHGVAVMFRSAVPDAAFHGDPVALTQAVTNLLSNAVESYAGTDVPPGRREASLELDREGEEYRVRVRDSGKGIPGEELRHVFEPFFTTKESEGGFGIGLSLARRIIEHLGGRIEVESAVGEGSVFTLYLPIREP